MNFSLRVGLIPLDDRPVNTRLVADVARLAGIELVIPPLEYYAGMGHQAPDDRLAGWLLHEAPGLDAIVISLNQLLFGGYIASRRFTYPLAGVLARFAVLNTLRERHPRLRVDAFITLMRTKDVNDGSAEPDYWSQYGVDIARQSAALHRREHGIESLVDSAVPRQFLDDFHLRRMRLHAVHLAAMEAVATGVLNQLVIAVEDSTVESVSTSEREWLEAWAYRLDVGDRVRCYPGADEVASAMLAGITSAHSDAPVRVKILADEERGLERVAPFEDVAVKTTLRHQCLTAGTTIVTGEAEFVLAIRTPAPKSSDWFRRPDGMKPTMAGTALTQRFVDMIELELDHGRVVVVADIAQANGGDPELIDALSERGILDQLGGYSGWNTAGNALGTALATGVALMVPGGGATQNRERMLAHRILDDVGYQAVLRQEYLAGRSGRTQLEFEVFLQEGLTGFLRKLPGLAGRWSVANAVLPWGRVFEVDFDLVPKDFASAAPAVAK